MKGMNYTEAVDYLLKLVDHERQEPRLPRQKRIYDLRRMTGFLEAMGEPHLKIPTVHVAGTKGKGSTAAMVDSALHAAGYRTGFYSSPHMHTFRERIRLNTGPVDEETFSSLVERLAPLAEGLSEETDLGYATLFEFMTGMAFHCFAEQSVDFQTIEVGLGGRLDATNVVQPAVCAITSISLDHMAILGDTIAEIASEKAGIIKKERPVVSAPQLPEATDVIAGVCREKAAPLVQVGVDVNWQRQGTDLSGQTLEVEGRLNRYQLRLPLLGNHQGENAATAVAVLECLEEEGHQIGADAIAEGFSRVSWPCRLEVLSREPLIVADGAHNVYSMQTMLASLRHSIDFGRLVVIAGFSRDKSVAGMVEVLGPQASAAVAARSRHPRSMAPGAVAAEFAACGTGEVCQAESVARALEMARSIAGPEDLILATGSLFVAAELREAVLGIEPEIYPDLLPADLR